MIKLQGEGYNPMFAYEEAIGFMNGTEIRDKDGVSPIRPPPQFIEADQLPVVGHCTLYLC